MSDNMETANALILADTTLPASFPGMTKKQITERVNLIVNNLLETGDTKQIIATAEAIAVMKKMEEQLRKDPRFTDLVATEAAKNGGRITTASGAEIKAGEVGIRYDYANDAEWCNLTCQIEDLIEKRKAREERMKSIMEGCTHVDTDSGEVTESAVKKSTTSYIITLAK